MVQLWIDDVEVHISEGSTVLAAARQLGIDIPALCHHDGQPPHTSCMCCLVRINEAPGFSPSCATVVREGMRVESESEAVRSLRRTGLELLLGDHAGDCHAPCENTCPARMDIPDMLRHVAEGDFRGAIAEVKRDIALPAILGRVCPEVCENACRRGLHDSPAAICKVKQFVADRDLASPDPYRPPVDPPTGKRVAVIGGGPTGLTAAFHLSQKGHECTLFERNDQVGGRLRDEFAGELPADILMAEATAVLSLGCETQLGVDVGPQRTLDELVGGFDAVLLTTGRCDLTDDALTGVQTTTSGLRVDGATRMTSREGVFAAGNAVRPYKLVVQSVAEGKLAAGCIDCWLRGQPPPDRRRAFETKLARLTAGELCDFCEGAPVTPRVSSAQLAEGLTEDLAKMEAERCLHCDCEALETCGLHRYAEQYGCNAQRFRGTGRRYEGRIVDGHVTLEPGKCILCGICVDMTKDAPDAVGLTFLDRSLQMRIGPPHGVSLRDAFGSVAPGCAAACPTGAIVVAPKPNTLKVRSGRH